MAQIHSRWWMSDGTHIFQVGQQLYKLHGSVLSNQSETFAEMFASLPPGQPELDGYNPDHPIVLPDITEHLFEAFLKIIYAQWERPPFDGKLLLELLDLGRKWQCAIVKKFAIFNIEQQCYSFHPAELIRLSVEYDIVELFKHAFPRLVETPIEELTNEHIFPLPMIVFIAYARASSAICKHRRRVAAEPPPVETHTADCFDHQQCTRDWRAVWWNGMGRCLVDGLHPQSYNEAIKMFQGMDFGEVGTGCRRILFETIDEGTAMAHERVLLKDIVEKLVVLLKFSTSTA